MINLFPKKLAHFFLVVALGVLADNSMASGFQLFAESVANISNTGAGYAAEANDASIGYSNPAGLIKIQSSQIVLAANSVKMAAAYTGSSTWFTTGDGLRLPLYNENNKSITGSDFNVIPAFHYAIPINSHLVAGLSVHVPFGLSMTYPEKGFQRYLATKTAIHVVNISSNLGFTVTDKLALGFGLDAQRLNAEIDLMAGAPSVLPAAPLKFDSLSENRIYSWGYGWHAGLLYQFSESTRIGASYHSQVVHHARGISTLTGPLAGVWAGNNGPQISNNLYTTLTLPSSTSLSIYHSTGTPWAFMATAIYTQWSTTKSLDLHNVAAIDSGLYPISNLTVPVEQYFKNTWSYMLGASYKLNTRWTFKTGIGYEQTPTNDQYRSLLIPDSSRWLASVGTHYQATRTIGLDFGWMHVFMKPANINNTEIAGPIGTKSNGRLTGAGDVIGIQIAVKLS